MKLFVWNDPYPVSYGSSLVFAVAETLEQAVELCKTGDAYRYGEFKQERRPIVDLAGVPPLRIVDVPCAEWHEWSE